MSTEAQKYLNAAAQKISSGNKKEAEAELDLAEMEIEFLEKSIAEPLLKQLAELKRKLTSNEIDPQVREGVLSSLQRRAENIKSRLQGKNTVQYEIRDFEDFLSRDENASSLTSEDIELFKKQIAGFSKLSNKYAAEEAMTDIRRVFESLQKDYQELLNALAGGNYSSINRATDSFERTGRRLEEETNNFLDNEEVQNVLEEANNLKIKVGEALAQQDEKEKQAELDEIQRQKDERENEKKQARAAADIFYTIPAQFPPDVITNEDGRTIGRIVFSPKPITAGSEKLDEITNSFSAGDQVFGMAYFADTRRNIGMERGLRIYIRDIEDGRGYSVPMDLLGSFTYESGNENANSKNYDLDIFATHEDAWDKELTAYLLKFLTLYLTSAPKSPDGDISKKIHRFQVDLQAGYQTVAKGDFSYDLRDGHQKMHEMYETHTNAHLKDFRLPESKRNDDELAEKIKQVMVAAGIDVQKVVFSTEDWGMVRHELSGAILRRAIWAYVVYKNKEGKCFFDDVQFTEEYVGNGFIGTIKKAGYGTANGQILEENI